MELPPHGPEEVRRIAALARIRLTAAECDSLAGDFGRILEYVGRLRARDEADAAAPLVHAVPPGEPAAALRADEPAPCLAAAEVLALAPDSAEGRVRVPRVLEEGR